MKKQLLAFCFAVWTLGLVAQSIPRPEYPRPQFQREAWVNLNGPWTFTFDFGKSGRERNLAQSRGFDRTINVPFCPESKLSGVQYTDFINSMWYHRKLQIPADWAHKRIVLHFGAVDYFATIYVDGKLAARHWGGTSSFEVDLTSFVTPGKEHDLVVQVEDDQRSGQQPKGKQCNSYNSQGCDYTRTTGIWQTVWMEAIAPQGLQRAYIVPDLDQKRFVVYPEFYSLSVGEKLSITVKDGDKTVSAVIVPAGTPSMAVLPLKTVKTWSPELPFLYDVYFEVLNAAGQVVDKVKSYAGMRKIHIEGNQYFINNKPYYLRFVLDQGFYPTGIWTAPSDADLRHDIELSMQAGFNGARLHQKVFEERFHYWADKLGYLTWGESSSWGCNTNDVVAARNFISEWTEIVMRDRNHPSIIAWTPFNETWERPNGEAPQHDRFISDVYKLSHNLDYRPVNDASGNYHVLTDLWTVHTYEQDPTRLADQLTVKDGVYFQNNRNKEVTYSGQPYFVDEYGGIKWVVGKQFAGNTWGYGEGPKTEEEFYQRLEGVTNAILNTGYISGYCYTQLTDVEQEQNGIYNYDRTPKFDMAKIKAIMSKNPQKEISGNK
ncbi:MAG: glycoside hydrolase family 2 TIM barrel-domain containing protein [Bacteroidota bacterium]|nr:glycoside hydrolase family 2 TIM barrel-domain containing protein [Bacteroidota bacterium]